MSNRWLYNSDYCDGQPCCADCDKCSIADKMLGEEGEALAHMETRLYFKHTPNGEALARDIVKVLEAKGYACKAEDTIQSIVVTWSSQVWGKNGKAN